MRPATDECAPDVRLGTSTAIADTRESREQFGGESLRHGSNQRSARSAIVDLELDLDLCSGNQNLQSARLQADFLLNLSSDVWL